MSDAWDGRAISASDWRKDCMVALNEADTPEAGADAAADFVLRTLADALGCDNWQVGDGSETWDGDVACTVYNILRAARVLHPETDEVARHGTPAEVAALVAERAEQAFAAGMEHGSAREAAAAAAMREAAVGAADECRKSADRAGREIGLIDIIRREMFAQSRGAEDARDAIRALPIPSADALAALLAEARREGIEAAAKVADRHAIWPTCSGIPGEAEAQMRAAQNASANKAQTIAAAIRALLEDQA